MPKPISDTQIFATALPRLARRIRKSQTYLEILHDYINLMKSEDEQIICSTIISREWNMVVTLPDDLPEIDEGYAKQIVDFLTHNPKDNLI